MRIRNEIFKANTTAQEKKAIQKIRTSNSFLALMIKGLHKDLNTKDLAELLGIHTRETLYTQMRKIFSELETASPRLKELSDPSRGCIDLNELVNEEWVGVIIKYLTVVHKLKKIRGVGRGIFVTDNFFLGTQQLFNSPFIQKIKELDLPVEMSLFAREVGKDADVIKFVIEKLFHKTIFCYDKWILAFNRRKKGSYEVFKNLLKIMPDATLETIYSEGKKHFPEIMNFDSLTHMQENINLNHNKLFQKLRENELKNNECYLEGKDKIIKFCEKIALKSEVCSTDTNYLSRRLEDEVGCVVTPEGLKALLLSSGKFLQGKKYVVSHHTKKGCEKETLKEKIEELYKEMGTVATDKVILEELQKRGRFTYLSNISIIRKKITEEKKRKKQ